MRSSLIIPAYCTDEYLTNLTYSCIESLDSGIRPDEVIVIDNGSTKPLEIPGVWMIREEINNGYAGAVNRGLAEATGDVMIVANNDMTFPYGWLQAIWMVYADGFDVAILRTSDELYEGQTGILPYQRMTSFWAITRKVYETIGELDTQFTGGAYADTDYCRRIREAGFKIGKNWDTTIQHVGSATFNLHSSDYGENALKYKHKWSDLN